MALPWCVTLSTEVTYCSGLRRPQLQREGCFSSGSPQTLSSQILWLWFPCHSWARPTAQPAQNTPPAPINPLPPAQLFSCQCKRWKDAFFLPFIKFQAEKSSWKLLVHPRGTGGKTTPVKGKQPSGGMDSQLAFGNKATPKTLVAWFQQFIWVLEPFTTSE